MYKIALIQNQSEMSHYGYADAREFISSYDDYEVFLYTAQNIFQLANDISNGDIDSIVLASHATNDIIIRNAIFSDEFAEALQTLFRRNGGLLILHQLRLGEQAMENPEAGKLLFLPDGLSNLTAMAREKHESPLDGTISFFKANKKHFLLNFPKKIDSEALVEQCSTNINLKGLYWHFWEHVDSGIWDIILEDDSDPNNRRPLVLSAKSSTKTRVIACSLTIDWQKQKDLFNNLLRYTVEGQQQVAFLKGEGDVDVDTLYFTERLKSKRQPHAVYTLPTDGNFAIRTISDDIHSIIIISKNAPVSPELQDVITEKKNSGKIKLISFAEDNFTVAGREHDELRILHNLEMETIGDLNQGYIDGSFWSTVESLQSLDGISQRSLTVTQKELYQVFDKISIHDKNGSYDGVFGATCALLWMRAKYLGPNHPDTRTTLEWLYAQHEKYEAQEQMLFLLTMCETETYGNIGRENVLAKMRDLLLSSKNNFRTAKEMSALTFLRCANLLTEFDSIQEIINCLFNQQKEGLWIDIPTTATIVTQLLKARNLLTNREYNTKELDQCLFLAVTTIQKSTNLSGVKTRPWGKKISINLKCIEALLAFDQMIELPITEIIDLIDTYSNEVGNVKNLETSLSILTDLSNQLTETKKENRKLEHKLEKLKVSHKQFQIIRAIAWTASIAASVLAYFAILFGMYTSQILIPDAPGLTNFWTFAQGQWGTHLAYLALLVAVVVPLASIKIHREITSNKTQEKDKKEKKIWKLHKKEK